MFSEVVQFAILPVFEAGLIGFFSFLAIMVFMRMGREIRRDGAKTRPDLLERTDTIMTAVLMGFFAFTIFSRFTDGKEAGIEKMRPDMLASAMLSLLIPPAVIVLMMIARNLNPSDVFGLRKISLLRAMPLGIGLGLLVLSLVTMVKILTISATQSTEASQELVQIFAKGIAKKDAQILAIIVLSATVVAPLSEEILFRGYFYPVLGRSFGRVPAAVFTAVFFAVLHDTLTDIPSLAVLSLCFTIAYERTGSLWVPIFAHACFNGVSLLVLWAATTQGLPV